MGVHGSLKNPFKWFYIATNYVLLSLLTYCYCSLSQRILFKYCIEPSAEVLFCHHVVVLLHFNWTLLLKLCLLSSLPFHSLQYFSFFLSFSLATFSSSFPHSLLAPLLIWGGQRKSKPSVYCNPTPLCPAGATWTCEHTQGAKQNAEKYMTQGLQSRESRLKHIHTA